MRGSIPTKVVLPSFLEEREIFGPPVGSGVGMYHSKRTHDAKVEGTYKKKTQALIRGFINAGINCRWERELSAKALV